MKEVVGADAIVAGNSLGGFTALAAAAHAPDSIKVGVFFLVLLLLFTLLLRAPEHLGVMVMVLGYWPHLMLPPLTFFGNVKREVRS